MSSTILSVYPDFLKRNFRGVISKLFEYMSDNELFTKVLGLYAFIRACLMMYGQSELIDHDEDFGSITLKQFQLLEHGLIIYTIYPGNDAHWNYGQNNIMEKLWDIFYWYNPETKEIEKPRTDLIPQPITIYSFSPMNIFEVIFKLKYNLNFNVDKHWLDEISDQLRQIEQDDHFTFEHYDHRIPANVIYHKLKILNLPDDFLSECQTLLTKRRN